MTRYNTPAEGTLDWHVPLNENFTQLGTDIEIRDAESNRDQYESSDGAKFLAIDTGAVYIGDGSQWNYLGDIVPEQSGTEGGESSLARPGEVQAVIDDVAAAGGGGVRLDSTEYYPQPSSPWELKSDVVLDFNGAILYGTGDLNDTDIIHVHPGAQIHNPRINLYNGGNGYTMSNGYRGRVFSLDTHWGKYFAYGTTIQNGHIAAVGDTGTACYLAANESNRGTWITHLDLNFDIGSPKGINSKEGTINTALHMDTSDGGNDAWINGVRISGNWRYVNTGILQTGVTGKYNQQCFNRFDVQVQPGENADSFWHIKDPTFARLNRWWGVIWDQGNYGDTAWRIDSQYQDSSASWRGCKRNAVNTPDLPPGFVRNKSPNDHFVTRTDRFSTTVV